MTQVLTQRGRVGFNSPRTVESPRVQATEESGLIPFALFVLVNVVLILRPGEFIEPLQELPIYEIVIVTCLMASWKHIVGQLSWGTIADQPVTACVYGLVLAAAFSHLAHGYFGGAWQGAVEVSKIAVYYTLLVSVVNSPRRLQQFLYALGGIIAITALLALLQYHDLIDLQAFNPYLEREMDDEAETITVISRLRAVGIFNDPNDLSLILVMAMLISLWGTMESRLGMAKIIWLAPLGLSGYALSLTQSRGGFLSFLAGCGVLFWGRFGWRRAVFATLVIVPLLFVMFGGRQTRISSTEDTAQGRLRLWWEGLDTFVGSPVFGIGTGEYVEKVGGSVAHNSFVQAYTELGFFGGTLFLGSFFSAFYGLHRLRSAKNRHLPPDVRRGASYLMAMVFAYAAGLMTLTRLYIAPTYIVLGLSTVYLRGARTGYGIALPRLDLRYVFLLIAVSGTFVVVLFVLLRVFVQWR